MKYVRYLKGIDELKGYSSMNCLQILYLGECRDRKLWLCFHLTETTKNILAIEKQTPEGPAFALISGKEFNGTETSFVDSEKVVLNNPEVFTYPASKIAEFIYDMDNNRL